MKGVDALIHVASPAPGNVGPEELFRVCADIVLRIVEMNGPQIAIEGSLNMIRQAEKAGVRRIVTTSSIGAVRNPNTNTWTDKGRLSVPCNRAIGLTHVSLQTGA